MPKKNNKKKPIKRNPVNKKPDSASKSNYTAKDIEVLEGLEPVRKRPGMYIGGTDTAALHHLVSEVLDNSMDEVVAGYADKVEIKLINSNTIEISDNGRGIPVDKHPKFKIPAAEVIMTTLHSGGKFSEGSYKTSGGLHGVGVSVVNALSINLTLEIARDKKFYIQTYSQGSPKSKLKAVSKNSIKNIKEIIDFNIEDSLKRAPYGQGIFKSIALNNTTDLEISEIKSRIKLEGKRYFDEAINKYDLDAVLSINNYHASYAAGAYYPCLTVPMGYRESGVPSNLTFIGPSYSEEKLYQLGYAFEKETNKRVSPFN